MKKIFLIIALFTTAVSSYSANPDRIKRASLDYEIKATTVNAGFVTVNVRISSFPKTEKIVFEYNSSLMERFTAFDVHGNTIKIKAKNDLVELDNREGSISISYKVKVSDDSSNKKDEIPNLMIDDAIMLIGANTFIIPKFPGKMNISPVINVNLAFPEFWKYACNWGNQTINYRISDFKTLLDGVIIAGDLQQEKITIKNNIYNILFLGNWEGSKERIMTIYKSIAKEQIDVWNFIPADFLIVAMIKQQSNSGQGRGIQYNNTIAYMLPNEIDLRDSEFLHLLAHEHFHLWNGAYLKPQVKDYNTVQWFHEGVTDYFSLLSLVRTNLIDEKEFLEKLKDNFLEYENLQATPDTYNRANGILLVFAIDMEIRKATHYNKSFIDVLRNMSLQNSFWEKGYGLLDLKAEIGKVANWDIADFFDKYINGHEKLNIKQYLDNIGLSFRTITNVVYTQGFDMEPDKTGQSNRAKNVKKDSAASIAGLLEGDLILEFVKPQKPMDLGKIKIKKGKIVKELSFSPWVQTNKIQLTRYKKTNLYKKWIGR